MAEQQEDIVPGVVDFNHRPAVRSKHGRWISASFIIWVEMAERIAFYGISGNLINFLTLKMGQPIAIAAANVNAWSGAASLLPIFGAVMADSFAGKYHTIIFASFIYILGLGLMTISAMLTSLSCHKQEMSKLGTPGCSSHLQMMMFFVALYLVAVGQGGHKPCVQAFGADQFDGQHPQERKAKSSFFNWWYFGLCFGALLGIGVLSYIQDNLSWALGFGIPGIIMFIALILFVCGTTTYRYTKIGAGGNPFKRIGQVFVSAARNWKAPLPMFVDIDEDVEVLQNISHGSRQFRFLNRALLPPEVPNTGAKVCSKEEVEEAKAVLRLIPIWATTLVFAIVFSQPPTFFTKQGITLDRYITSKFAIPAAALQSFTGICIIIFIPIYDRVLVPTARKWTGNPSGISMLQRIGAGLFISIFSMIIAALTERKRLKTVAHHGLIGLPYKTIPMSIWWLLPQYALFGISEAFTMVGLQEFFYDQVPNDLRSVGLSLYLSIFGIGGILSSVLVSLINNATSKGGGHSWFSNNLNRAHLDYFYFVLAGLSVIGLALFVYVARSYIYNKSNARIQSRSVIQIINR